MGERRTNMAMKDELGHNFKFGLNIFSKAEDGSTKPLDYFGAYRCVAVDSEDAAQGAAHDEEDKEGAVSHLGGVGTGSGTTTVTIQQNAPPGGQPPSQVPDNHVALGDTGVGVTNVFAKEELVTVDANPNLRAKLCGETYCCFCCGACGDALFCTFPDCLGAGSSCVCCFGELAWTCKLLQKPTCCEFVAHFVCFDISTCCTKKDETDKTCCSVCAFQRQTTWCCLFQESAKCRCGIMKTCVQCWGWCCCYDTRFAIPFSDAVPLQCLCCGCGWRKGEGCGFRCRAVDDSVTAPAPTTTVVIVNQAPGAAPETAAPSDGK